MFIEWRGHLTNSFFEIFYTPSKEAVCSPHIGPKKMGFVVRATDKTGVGGGRGWGPVGGVGLLS